MCIETIKKEGEKRGRRESETGSFERKGKLAAAVATKKDVTGNGRPRVRWRVTLDLTRPRAVTTALAIDKFHE